MYKKPTYEELEQRVKELERDASERVRVEAELAPKSEQTAPSNIGLENPYLVDGKYSIRDLVDIETFGKTLEKFSLATGFTTGFLEYPSQEILVATGWRDICTKFHRTFPESLKHCKESNIYLSEKLRQLKELNIKPCENGLVDGATPIVIKGKYIAYLATGQVLFEEPDIERFIRQAEINGYDVETYLEALSKVPVVSEEQFKNALSFLSELATTIAESGLHNLKLKERGWELEEEITERKEAEKRLQESEKKYRNLFENGSDLLCIHDLEGNFLETNLSYKKQYGLNNKDVRGLNIRDFIPGRYKPEFDQYLERIIQNGMDEGYLRAIAKSGDEVILEYKNKLIYDDKGRPMSVQGSARDVTSRLMAEKAIKESEKKFKSIFNNATEGIALADTKTKNFYMCNQMFLDMFGYNLEEIMSLGVADIHPRNDLPRVLKEFESHAKREKTFAESIPCLRRDGTIFYADVNTAPVEIRGRKYNIGFFRDTTEQKRSEKALRESEERYRVFFEKGPDGVVILEPETAQIIEFNDPACRQLGYSREEFARLRVFDIEVKETFEETHARIQKVMNQGYDDFETLQRTKQGEIRHVHVTAQLIEAAGKPVFQCIWRDITERKRADKEKKMLETQLRQSQKLESIGVLAGGIAHDFNNILASIIGFTELALDDVEKGTPLEDSIQEVYAAGKRARDLVKQILAFARQSDEKQMPVQVDKIAKEALKFIRSTIPTSIEIRQKLESRSLIMGNPTQIHQIFMNLCTNAAHAMEDRTGIMEVGLADVELDGRSSLIQLGLKPGNYIKMTVSDTGSGIGPNIIGSIFEPYFTTKGVGEGTGMGLALTHGIVESYGGKITVDSERGKGTVFTIYLPITEKRKDYRLYEEEKLPSGNERILFVDDELPIAKMSSQILERLGYRITVRTSSVEALELFRSKPDQFDLVITDMTMPNMTGDELAMELIAFRSDIPVILCTGYSKKITDEKAAKIGIRAFAYKPIVTPDLAKTVRKVLDEAKKNED